MNIEGLKATLALVEAAAATEDSEIDWDQGEWRGLEVEGNRCNTSMCFAGFDCERNGYQWVITPAMALKANTGTENQRNHVVDGLMSMVFVTEDEAETINEFWDGSACALNKWISKSTISAAIELGLEADLNRFVAPAEDVARYRIGLRKGQAQRLFGGGNTLERLQNLVAEFEAESS